MFVDDAVAHYTDPAERYEAANAILHEIARRQRRAALARKRCPSCELDRPLADFSANAGRPDGLQGWCRACRSARRSGDKPGGPSS